VYGQLAVHDVLHIYIVDYIPFIILLGALFTVSGGIFVRGSFTGTPILNAVFLAIGTLIASWVGTTGAAMLLIRPVLRANARRSYRAHTVVFFIFLVANIGGSLTPLGDPPLFLGFLHGVPFFWTFRCCRRLAVATLVLLLLRPRLVLYRRESEAARRAARGDEDRGPITCLPRRHRRGRRLRPVAGRGGDIFGIHQQVRTRPRRHPDPMAWLVGHHHADLHRQRVPGARSRRSPSSSPASS
jgi:Na+/H+ antiporter NhaD/arsenite permease-like protein